MVAVLGSGHVRIIRRSISCRCCRPSGRRVIADGIRGLGFDRLTSLELAGHGFGLFGLLLLALLQEELPSNDVLIPFLNLGSRRYSLLVVASERECGR